MTLFSYKYSAAQLDGRTLLSNNCVRLMLILRIHYDQLYSDVCYHETPNHRTNKFAVLVQ